MRMKLSELEDRIASDRLKMSDLILENNHTLVPSISREYPGIFRNVNNEEELKMTEEKMERFKIKAFGMLAEKLPASEFDFPYFQNTEELLAGLTEEYPQLKSLKFSLAVDKVLIQEKHHLNGNEEIALLPPFSGG